MKKILLAIEVEPDVTFKSIELDGLSAYVDAGDRLIMMVGKNCNNKVHFYTDGGEQPN